MKPTVTGLGMALDLDRRRLWEIRTGNIGTSTPDVPAQVKDTIKKTYYLMENLWENYMQNGKINPVSGIFIGKNYYGMVDKQEYVLTPNAQNDGDFDAEDIKKRYLTDAPPVESKFIESD